MRQRRAASAAVPTGRASATATCVTDGNGNSTVYPAGRHGRRRPEGDRSCHRRPDRYASLPAVRHARNRQRPPTASIDRQRLAADLDRHDRRPVDHRHRQCAVRRSASPATPERGTSFTAGRTAAPGSLSGKTLTFTSFNGGTAVNVTFGDGTNGTVKTLDQLNAALLANNLSATVELDRQADDLRHQRLCFVDPRFGDGRRRDRRLR